MAEHETIGMIKTTEAGIEIHLKSGLQTIIDGGLSLILKAGGQHIVLNPAGIFTTPIFPGGAPLAGTPAVPIPPMTKQYGVPSTNSPAVKASKAVTALLNTLLQPAQAQENPPEVIKKIKVIISPLPEMAGYINEPYTLYADGARLQQGVTDHEGAILFNHIPSIKEYNVKLVNGHQYTFSLQDQESQPLQQEDQLGMQGYRRFEQSMDTVEPLETDTDYRSAFANPSNKDKV